MKSNKTYQPPSGKAEILFLVCIALFAAAALFFGQKTLAAAEGIVFLILLAITLITKRRESRQLVKYIESITYDTENAKNSTLLSFPLPMAVFRLTDSSVVWGNDAFFHMFDEQDSRLTAKMISLIPDFSGKWLMEGKSLYPVLAEVQGRKYQLYGNLENSRPVPGIVVIDNLDELVRNYPERVKNDLRDSVEDHLHHWCEKYHGILRRYDRDRYLVIFEKKDLERMRADKFSILEELHQVENPAGIAASISIGFGEDAATLEEGLQFADIGTELALSRGGDQTVIKNRVSFEFFGGRGLEVERRTKVKSRVMANTLSELIRDSSKVFVMGHKFADLDALGADIGICCLARKLGAKSYMILDQNNNAAKPLLDLIKQEADYRDSFLSPHDAMIMADARTLLVVVDTNRPEQVEDSSLLASCNRVAVIDHHRVGATYIQNAALGFIEPYASSACELITEIMQELIEPNDVRKVEAEALLSGIVLDTKSFSIRTGERTYDAASWLRRCGADPAAVKKLFKNDMDTTVARNKLMQNAKLYRGVAVVITDEVQERIVLAQAADELLNVSGVEAAVVASPDRQNGISVSARSIGEMNVQILMEKLGGGGNRSAAAAKLEHMSVNEVEKKIHAAIDDYLG